MFKTVIYTCIVRNYNSLPDITEKNPSIDYVCFTDNKNLNPNGWKLCSIPKDLKQYSKSKQQRYIKIFPHKYLSDYDISIWVDSTTDLKSINSLLNSCNFDEQYIFLKNNSKFNCLYKKAISLIYSKQDFLNLIDTQIKKYKSEKYPENNGLVDTDIIIRKHNDHQCIKLMDFWMNEINNNSSNDYLSFNYSCWKTNGKYGILNENKKELKCKSKKIIDNFNNIFVSQKNFDLIVSLTTYKPRLEDKTLFKILPSLLNQKTNLKYKICITFYKDDFKYITEDLKLYLNENNIEIIKAKENLRSHLKYFYAMQKYREYPIITVDDDCYYNEDLIQTLYDSYIKYPNYISCRRCHLITYDENGKALPYEKWKFQYRKEIDPCFDIFATGVGGVLYPPNILDISNELIPKVKEILTADDIYLKYRENEFGIKVAYVPSKDKFPYTLDPSGKATYSLSLLENKVNNTDYIRKLDLKKLDIQHNYIEISYICDEKYIKLTFLSLQSLKKSMLSTSFYRISIIYNGNNEKIQFIKDTLSSENFEIMIFNVSYTLPETIQKSNVSKTAMYKFMIASILNQYDRVIYLDCDTLILRDLSRLWNIDIGNKFAGVVKDYKVCMEYTKPFHIDLVKRNNGYFNSGMMLLNLKLLREKNIEKELFYAKENKENYFMDQDTLNDVFNGNVIYLPVEYNYIYSYVVRNYDKLKSIYPESTICKTIDDIKKTATVFHLTGISDKNKIYEWCGL